MKATCVHESLVKKGHSLLCDMAAFRPPRRRLLEVTAALIVERVMLLITCWIYHYPNFRILGCLHPTGLYRWVFFFWWLSLKFAYPSSKCQFHTTSAAPEPTEVAMISFMIVSLNPAGRRSFRRRRSGELPSVLPVPVWQGQCQ